jgi:hypothetical protein
MPVYRHVAAFVTFKIASSKPKLAKALIFDYLFRLLAAYRTQSLPDVNEGLVDLSGLPIIATETQLETTIAVIQSLLVANELCDSVLDYLAARVFHPVYQMYIKSAATKSHMTQELLDILQILLRFFALGKQVDVLMALITESFEFNVCQINPRGGGVCFVRDLENKYVKLI